MLGTAIHHENIRLFVNHWHKMQHSSPLTRPGLATAWPAGPDGSTCRNQGTAKYGGVDATVPYTYISFFNDKSHCREDDEIID